MTPPAHSVAAAFPGAWFATNPGKTRLRRIAADLESKGLACRFHPSRDRRGLRLRLPDATLLLGANFPASSPLMLSGPARQIAENPFRPGDGPAVMAAPM